MNVPFCAKLCILGIYPKDFPFTSNQRQILDFGLLQARRAIAFCWKSMDAPTLGMWTRELLSCIGLERLTYISKGKGKDFNKLWEPYMAMLTEENMRPA